MVQAPQEAEVMAQQGRIERSRCGSGRKVKRCCGVRRGPSEADLAKAFLHQQARAAALVLALDARTVLERDPVILKVANSWIILIVGGGPTEDKPAVTLETPADPHRTSAFLNIRSQISQRPIGSGAQRVRNSSPSHRIEAGSGVTCAIRTVI